MVYHAGVWTRTRQPATKKTLIHEAVLKKKRANPKLKNTEYTEPILIKLNMADTDSCSYNNPTGLHVQALYMLHNLHNNLLS
jgi:hypothetical protein